MRDRNYYCCGEYFWEGRKRLYPHLADHYNGRIDDDGFPIDRKFWKRPLQPKPSGWNFNFKDMVYSVLKYWRKTLRLKFERGVQILKDDGTEIDPLGDLNTEAERKLALMVLRKYDTNFYILHRYPLAVRPYTMPCRDGSLYSSSFDVFIQGEKIISGSQCVQVLEFLTERAQACGRLKHVMMLGDPLRIAP